MDDGCVGRMNYETNFNRMFFLYRAPLPLQEIDAEWAGVERCILDLMQRWETYVKRLT